MIIRRISPLTGHLNELDLDITEQQLHRWWLGESIQHVMPNLTSDEREYLIMGLYPGEHEEYMRIAFGEEE